MVDPQLGEVRIGGRLHHHPGSRTLLLVVHGLGGSSRSPYTFEAAAIAQRYGFSSLRLDLRGADLRGEDFFHAGLAQDLQRALTSPECRHYERVLVLGYSLGGHLSLRHAALVAEFPELESRLKGVAAICPPLDLYASATAFDEAALRGYRHYVLSALKRMYAAVYRRRERASLNCLPVDMRQASQIRYIREWDDRIVAPRFGFENALHYYRECSVAPVLKRVRVPTLLLSAKRDPMVPHYAVAPYREGLPDNFQVSEMDRGGHIGFPASLDLGEKAPLGLDNQVIAWLARQANSADHTVRAAEGGAG